METISVEEDLAQPRPGTVCRVQMWLDSQSDMAAVLESLNDPAIQFLDLYVRKSFMASFLSQRVHEVMKKIGELVNLERLDISSPYCDNTTSSDSVFLPVSAIQMALSPSLTHLLLVNIKIGGSPEEFEAFANTTSKLPELHCVVLAEVRLFRPPQISHTTDSHSLIDPFLQALTKIEALAHVLISGSHELGVLQPSTLQLCVQSASFRDLCLSQLSLATPHLQAISQAPHGNLRELDLQCHLTIDGARALADMLQNNCTLEELTLRLTTKPESYQATTRVPLASALLEDDNMYDGDDIGEEDAENDNQASNQESMLQEDSSLSLEYQRNMILATGIVQSTRLSGFELENANLSTTTLLEPFRLMLRNNYSLETARFHCGIEKESHLEDEIAFFTRLNHIGRRHLFQCPHCSYCDSTYVTMLSNLQGEEDLGAFFYFLSSKPSLLANQPLLCAASSPGSPRRATGKRKRLYRAVKYNGQSYKS